MNRRRCRYGLRRLLYYAVPVSLWLAPVALLHGAGLIMARRSGYSPEACCAPATAPLYLAQRAPSRKTPEYPAPVRSPTIRSPLYRSLTPPSTTFTAFLFRYGSR